MADRRWSGLALSVALLSGCSMAPPYHPPVVAAPAAFHETGPWVPATPALPADGAAWWRAFGDPVLDELERRIEHDSPTLAAALARRDGAFAALRTARADTMPTVGAGLAPSYNRQSQDRPLRGATQPEYYGSNTLSGSFSYEIDLWGRVRNEVASGRANAMASADDVAAVRLSLQGDLANAYLTLRGLDQEADLLVRTVDAYRQADTVIQNRFRGGIATGIDTGRSAAQLADAQAQLADVQNTRARVEHAIAALVGVPASAFALARAAGPVTPVGAPVGLPSTLLQRRPDVAAAERRVFAANADIGVARAAFFPQIGLGATGGTQSTTMGGLLAAPNTFWSLGPGVALNLFDGGRRRAAVAAARARWAEATAHYRETALGAFQQAEDALSGLHHLGDEQTAQERAAGQAAQAADLSMVRYTKGAATYLDVVTAQTAALAAQRRAIQIRTARLQAGVALVRALGGGWQQPG